MTCVTVSTGVTLMEDENLDESGVDDSPICKDDYLESS